MTKEQQIIPNADNITETKLLTPAAQRALDEAAERRKKAQLQTDDIKKELGGRGGQDPARYGDWEIKGRAIDF